MERNCKLWKEMKSFRVSDSKENNIFSSILLFWWMIEKNLVESLKDSSIK